MEEKELLQELKAIRHLARQTWIMVIVLVAVVAVPAVLLGCTTVGMILLEFLPH
jgi:aspartate/glutamate racemase